MGKTMWTQWFFFRGSRICQYASPHCVDCSLGGLAANWHHPPSPHIGYRKNLPTIEGSSMTRSTRVALRGSCGASIIPLTITSLEHRTNFLACFNRDHATKPSRRWQSLRLTSITSLQLDHLVSLDAITQCNALETLTSQWICTSCKHKWVRGFSNQAQRRATHPQGAQP
jgi:hypothetical protein